MTDLSTSLADDGSPELSTQLDAPRASDETLNAKPPVEEKKPPESRLDAIKRAADDVAPKEAKETAKEPEKAKEPAPASDDAPEKPAEAEEKPKLPEQERRPAKDHIEPPAKFMPRSKELWINTPREVKADVQRVVAEAEAEVAKAGEAVKEYEPLRRYAEMAKQGGTTLDVALDKYVRMEQTLRTNPSEGFRGLLDNMQMTPVQAIGHVLAAYNVRPEQLMQHLSQNPHEYTPQQRQQMAAQQERQPDPEVATLKSELAQIREQMTAAQIIEPFAAANPRYYELQEDIAFFLNSGKVPASLSPQDRLAAAYDMAVRISPQSSYEPAPAQQGTQAPIESRAGDDFGGTKSVRGAPASGVNTTSKSKSKMSREEAIRLAMADQ
jgi:hypothetical protein